MYELAGEFAIRRIAGEMIVVPVRAGVGDLDAIFTLNEVGAEIWAGLRAKQGIPAIAGLVAARFDVEPDRAEQDVRVFLQTLLSAGLVRGVGER